MDKNWKIISAYLSVYCKNGSAMTESGSALDLPPEAPPSLDLPQGFLQAPDLPQVVLNFRLRAQSLLGVVPSAPLMAMGRNRGRAPSGPERFPWQQDRPPVPASPDRQ
ncbi:hypothetical protein UPYG_G00315200 [Umbra pygmaea]|uniref:Uncharacterized protein n=1 Tax=Umbra pygmaea TaxID=75934 RepID=A0ABD0W4F5_UMBPY